MTPQPLTNEQLADLRYRGERPSQYTAVTIRRDYLALLAEVDWLRAERDRHRTAWHSARRRAGENSLAGRRFTGSAVRDALIRAGYITRRDTVATAVQRINEAPRPWYVRWLVDRLQYAARAHASTVQQAKRQARRAGQLAAELGGRDEEARERWIQQQEQQLGLKYADFRAGRWEMDLAMGREMAAAYVAMAKTLLGDAPNYSETRLEFDVKIAESPELYTLVVQRHAPGAVTPHEARQRAEAERDEAAQLSHQYRNDRDRLARQLDAARAVREQWAEHCLGPQTRALLADLDTALAPPADAPPAGTE